MSKHNLLQTETDKVKTFATQMNTLQRQINHQAQNLAKKLNNFSEIIQNHSYKKYDFKFIRMKTQQQQEYEKNKEKIRQQQSIHNSALLQMSQIEEEYQSLFQKTKKPVIRIFKHDTQYYNKQSQQNQTIQEQEIISNKEQVDQFYKKQLINQSVFNTGEYLNQVRLQQEKQTQAFLLNLRSISGKSNFQKKLLWRVK